MRNEDSQVGGRALYEQILIKRAGLTPIAAAEILERTEESFCIWPSKREVRYQDVVSYVVVQDYLRSYPILYGTKTDMRLVVSRVISHDL